MGKSPQRVWRASPDRQDDWQGSDGSIVVLSGGEVTAWSSVWIGRDERPEYALKLEPDCPVVVGRSNGGVPPYLDPAYHPTRIVPGTGRSVLHSGGRGTDRMVSRGHFTLHAIPGGILFVNGVPRRGGGLRPPLNGTWLIAPEGRALDPEEEYPIESGTCIIVGLPNGSEIQINAG